MQVTVEQKYIVAMLLQQGLGVAEFQRKMRLAAAEIDTVLETPWRIDQRHSHADALCG